MAKIIRKNFDTADESMQPTDKIKVDVLDINGRKIRRVTAQSGWKWSIDLKPVVKTSSCQEDHLLYMISGDMVVRMDDGKEVTYSPGDIAAIPPGHDGWGIGSKSTIWVELPH